MVNVSYCSPFNLEVKPNRRSASAWNQKVTQPSGLQHCRRSAVSKVAYMVSSLREIHGALFAIELGCGFGFCAVLRYRLATGFPCLLALPFFLLLCCENTKWGGTMELGARAPSFLQVTMKQGPPLSNIVFLLLQSKKPGSTGHGQAGSEASTASTAPSLFVWVGTCRLASIGSQAQQRNSPRNRKKGLRAPPSFF